MASNPQSEWLDYWLPKAEAGDPEAQIALGWEHFRGEYVKKDIALAEKWFRAANHAAPEKGYYQLFKMYWILRDGRIHELFQSQSWNTGAIYFLYGHYRQRDGASKSELQLLFRKGSELGHLISRIRLHQVSSTVVERIIRAPVEIRLLVEALRINWRDPDDLRVLQ